jgi:raffinose/stachyose/melibiose transport system substrate-binding protein
LSLAAVVGISAALLTACSTTSDNTGSSTDPAKLTYLSSQENTTVQGILKDLSTNQCAAENKALPLSISTQPQAQIDQKLQLLAGQKALPSLMMPNSPAITKTLTKSGALENMTTELKKLGVADDITPAALSTMQQVFGDEQVTLPTEFNVEGIWYNKKIFTENNITVPETWDALVAAAAKLDAAGVQPFSAAGKDGWPVTRLIGDYLFRDIGPDAMKNVADGTAKLTDAKYVKAATAVADLGAKGYFGPSVGSIDYNTAANTFMSGKAAMFYMGTWTLANFNDPKQNLVGADNIGFMPFPAVSGGAGTIDQIPANVGTPITFSSKTFGPKTAAWVKCIAENYGTVALKSVGLISGFKVNTPVDNLPALTQEVQTTIANTKSTVLWFEALFSSKGNTVSNQNAGPLLTGQVSPQDYMSLVQAAHDQ